MTRTPEFDAWVQRAREADILEQALAHGAQLKRSGGEYIGPCPVDGGTDCFAINTKKNVFICRAGGVGGDVIALVGHLENMPFLVACEAINQCPPPGRGSSLESRRDAYRDPKRQAQAAARRESQQEAERNNRRRAGEIWRASGLISGTVAEVYLNHRGIPTPPEGWPECFRFHPSLAYPRAGKHPALICRADNASGVPVAIWREYLAADGRGKAKVDKPKLGLGGVAGAAVRIGGCSGHIGVAEGVLSALGAWFLTGRKFPVWSCLSTSGMTGFNVPAGVERLTIFPDGDRGIRKRGDQFEPSEPPGRAAARKLQERLHSQSIPCVIAAEPSPGRDYLDLFVQSQKESAA